MKKIYLAGPYSHLNPDIRLIRFFNLNSIAGDLMTKGYLVFSPISHTHPIAEQCGLPMGFDFWDAFDRTFIEWCDELWVAMLDGWKESTGVSKEIIIATEMKKPVRYI